MSIMIPILERSKKFGYIIWKKDKDFDMRAYFKDIQEVEVFFEGKNIGKKRIDWKNRRISIGWANTRKISSDKKEYKVALWKEGKLSIKCL